MYSNLQRLMEITFDIRSKIPESNYLEMCNIMKELHISNPKPLDEWLCPLTGTELVVVNVDGIDYTASKSFYEYVFHKLRILKCKLNFSNENIKELSVLVSEQKSTLSILEEENKKITSLYKNEKRKKKSVK